jgi:hypothetical protein
MNKLSTSWDASECVEKHTCRAALLRGFKGVVGDMESVVDIDSEDAEVQVRDVEERRSDEDFDGGWVGDGS